jgi:hypothetical protein
LIGKADAQVGIDDDEALADLIEQGLEELVACALTREEIRSEACAGGGFWDGGCVGVL